MSEPTAELRMTGKPISDVRVWMENANLPPAMRREVEAEFRDTTSKIIARVHERLEHERGAWTETFDALTDEADAVADAYAELRAEAARGDLTADEMDDRMSALERRRRVLEARAHEPEQQADRINKTAEDPLAAYEELLLKYPALPRPSFSFLNVQPL
jgi:chromosome segregation ATPase